MRRRELKRLAFAARAPNEGRTKSTQSPSIFLRPVLPAYFDPGGLRHPSDVISANERPHVALSSPAFTRTNCQRCSVRLFLRAATGAREAEGGSISAHASPDGLRFDQATAFFPIFLYLQRPKYSVLFNTLSRARTTSPPAGDGGLENCGRRTLNSAECHGALLFKVN
jgi:hypothetical protein